MRTGRRTGRTARTGSVIRWVAVWGEPSAAVRPEESVPRTMFSATVKTSTWRKFWWTMPMPAAIASFGEEMSTALPSTSTVPASGA